MGYKLSNITVLIVDDAQEMFEITRSVLQTFGINRIISAHDLRSGFRKFYNYNPDLVIVDWLENMDLSGDVEMADGLKLVQAIRQDPKSPNPYVPIIMMTGYTIRKNIDLARDIGATEFIAKPFTADTLCKKIEHIIEKPRRFVKAPDFFGPDRRRQDVPFNGIERRADDLVFTPVGEKG